MKSAASLSCTCFSSRLSPTTRPPPKKILAPTISGGLVADEHAVGGSLWRRVEAALRQESHRLSPRHANAKCLPFDDERRRRCLRPLHLGGRAGRPSRSIAGSYRPHKHAERREGITEGRCHFSSFNVSSVLIVTFSILAMGGRMKAGKHRRRTPTLCSFGAGCAASARQAATPPLNCCLPVEQSGRVPHRIVTASSASRARWLLIKSHPRCSQRTRIGDVQNEQISDSTSNSGPVPHGHCTCCESMCATESQGFRPITR